MMKKTITPVISVILLIMLTIAVSATAWYWVNNLQGNLEASSGQGVTAVTGMGNIQYSIVGLVCNKSANITVTLRNNGLTSLQTTDVFLVKIVNNLGEELDSEVVALGATLETTGTNSIGYLRLNSSTTGWGTLMTTGVRYQIKTDVNGVLQSEYCIASE